MNWSEVLADKSLQNLPYKIELNEYGKIEMAPATNRHSYYQSKIDRLLGKIRRGATFTECSIETAKGVKVADVAWCSPEFIKIHGIDETPFTNAPDICVEIVSPGNSPTEMEEKKALYFDKGAQEVWLIFLDGTIQLFNQQGKMTQSQFGIHPQMIQKAMAIT